MVHSCKLTSDLFKVHSFLDLLPNLEQSGLEEQSGWLDNWVSGHSLQNQYKSWVDFSKVEVLAPIRRTLKTMKNL